MAVLSAMVTTFGLAAELLQATGRDGLAGGARTIAHLLQLVAICVGQRGDDRP